jgi:hypothetical protein
MENHPYCKTDRFSIIMFMQNNERGFPLSVEITMEEYKIFEYIRILLWNIRIQIIDNVDTSNLYAISESNIGVVIQAVPDS